MREIKFRAWDKKYNQILYGGEVWERHPKWYSIDFITNKGIVIWNKLGNDAGPSAYENQKIIMNEDIIIMQFIGLKDKNGKDIYEGDVVEMQVHYKSKCIVAWNENYCGFFPFLQYNVLDNNVALQFEVFGNIYETPELIIP